MHSKAIATFSVSLLFFANWTLAWNDSKALSLFFRQRKYISPRFLLALYMPCRHFIFSASFFASFANAILLFESETGMPEEIFIRVFIFSVSDDNFCSKPLTE